MCISGLSGQTGLVTSGLSDLATGVAASNESGIPEVMSIVAYVCS